MCCFIPYITSFMFTLVYLLCEKTIGSWQQWSLVSLSIWPIILGHWAPNPVAQEKSRMKEFIWLDGVWIPSAADGLANIQPNLIGWSVNSECRGWSVNSECRGWLSQHSTQSQLWDNFAMIGVWWQFSGLEPAWSSWPMLEGQGSIPSWGDEFSPLIIICDIDFRTGCQVFFSGFAPLSRR